MQERQQNHSQFTIIIYFIIYFALRTGPQFGFMKKRILKFWGFVFCRCICFFQHPNPATALRFCFSLVAFLTAVMTSEDFLHLQIFQCISPPLSFLQATCRYWKSECHLLPLAQVWACIFQPSVGREGIVAIIAVV